MLQKLHSLRQGNEDARFSWKDKGVLYISDLQVGDTGQYICLNDNEYEAVHMLEVVHREPTRQVSSYKNPSK